MAFLRERFSTNDLQNICASRDFHWHHNSARVKSGGLLLGVNYTYVDVIYQEDKDYYIR